MLEDARVYARNVVDFSTKLIEGSGTRYMLQLVVFEDSETHVGSQSMDRQEEYGKQVRMSIGSLANEEGDV
jgi:hypothetical protein